ncbi:MAG: DoxX family protein [Granulosicoccaceae bacterium]
MLDFEVRKRSSAENNGLVLLRLTVGLMLLVAGVQKAVFPEQLSEFASNMAAINLPENAVYVVYFFEIAAPLMIILGIASRLAAGFVVLYMLIALLVISSANLLVLIPGRGHALEAEFMYLLGALAICFLGSGDKAIFPD